MFCALSRSRRVGMGGYESLAMTDIVAAVSGVFQVPNEDRADVVYVLQDLDRRFLQIEQENKEPVSKSE